MHLEIQLCAMHSCRLHLPEHLKVPPRLNVLLASFQINFLKIHTYPESTMTCHLICAIFKCFFVISDKVLNYLMLDPTFIEMEMLKTRP